MLARLRKSAEENEQGFTLIELLVVMIIIGILAAIAVPVFLSQRQKARDTATKADVSSVGKEIASYYVDGTDKLTSAISGNTLTLSTTTPVAAVATVKLSADTTNVSGSNAVSYLTGTGCTTNANSWLVSLRNPDGSQKNYFYSASSGLTSTAPTTCS